MEFAFDERSQTIQCRFSAKMDAISSAEAAEIFGKGIKEVSLRPGDFAAVFDMKGVEYVSSAFLRLCLSAAKQTREGGFSIINTEPQIMKVFKIAGLDALLRVS